MKFYMFKVNRDLLVKNSSKKTHSKEDIKIAFIILKVGKILKTKKSRRRAHFASVEAKRQKEVLKYAVK